MAHELRNLIQTALLAFDVLKSGRVGIAGSTGAALGRSLVGLSARIDATLAEVRLATAKLRRVQASVRVFVDEVVVAARLHAEYRGIQLTVEPVDPALRFDVDRQHLASALTNLLQNAFKFTREHGEVTLRTRCQDGRVLLEVEDQCGGLAVDEAKPSGEFGDRRRSDRSGLGLGLSIARKAVKAMGGDLHTRNLPGQGCIFSIDLPVLHAVRSAPPVQPRG
jgi:signal transduction histidine kinase